MQLLLVILSGVAGLPGLTLGVFAILLRLCGLKSLGVPYLAPAAPKERANPDQLLRAPVWRLRLRGMLASPLGMRRTPDGPMRAWESEERHDR